MSAPRGRNAPLSSSTKRKGGGAIWFDLSGQEHRLRASGRLQEAYPEEDMKLPAPRMTPLTLFTPPPKKLLIKSVPVELGSLECCEKSSETGFTVVDSITCAKGTQSQWDHKYYATILKCGKYQGEGKLELSPKAYGSTKPPRAGRPSVCCALPSALARLAQWWGRAASGP